MPLTARRQTQVLIDPVVALGGPWHGRTAMCLCQVPAYSTPSPSIRQGDRGILVTSIAGCNRKNILRELWRIPISNTSLTVTRPCMEPVTWRGYGKRGFPSQGQSPSAI